MRESEHVKEHIKSFVRWRCLLSGMPDVVQKLKPPPRYHVPWECSTSQAKSVLLNPIRITDVERLQSHNKILFSKFIDQVLGLWCQGCVKRPLVVNQPQIQHACCLVYRLIQPEVLQCTACAIMSLKGRQRNSGIRGV